MPGADQEAREAGPGRRSGAWRSETKGGVMMAITRVWIEEGCTMCGLCESTCPEIFFLGEESAEVNEDANLEENESCIEEAAENCPVEVIRFE